MKIVVQEKQEGMGHAVLTASIFCNDEPFLLVIAHHFMDSESKTLNCFSQLLKAFEDTGNDTVAVRQVAPECISKYGVAACVSYGVKANMKITKMEEVRSRVWRRARPAERTATTIPRGE